MPSYIVREEDGTSKILLEEGTGAILTEESQPDAQKTPPIPQVVTPAGGMRW